MIIHIHPRDLKAGDVFKPEQGTGYRVLLDAYRLPADTIETKVQYIPDGGIGFREWDTCADVSLRVERA